MSGGLSAITPRTRTLDEAQLARLDRCVRTLVAQEASSDARASGAPETLDSVARLQDFVEGAPHLLSVIGSKTRIVGVLVRCTRAWRADTRMALKLVGMLVLLVRGSRKNADRLAKKVPNALELIAELLHGDDRLLLRAACDLAAALATERREHGLRFLRVGGVDAVVARLRAAAEAPGQEHDGQHQDDEDLAAATCALLHALTAQCEEARELLHEGGATPALAALLRARMTRHVQPNGIALGLLREPLAPLFLGAAHSAVSGLAAAQLELGDALASPLVMELCRFWTHLRAGGGAWWGWVPPEDGETLFLRDTYVALAQLAVCARGRGPGSHGRLAAELDTRVPELVDEFAGLLGLDPACAAPPVRECAAAYRSLLDEAANIRANHFDEDSVSESLRVIGRVLAEVREAKHLAARLPEVVSALTACLNDIDERVMTGACRVALALIADNEPAQLEFLRFGGLAALGECLYDYNVTIRLLALQNVSILAAAHAFCRDELRTSGVLDHVLAIVRQFLDRAPDADVTLEVVTAAVGVLTHVLLQAPANQDHVRGCEPNNGVDSLRDLIGHCRDAGEPALLARTLEVLGNLVYRSPDSQDAVRTKGVLALAADVLRDCDDAGGGDADVASAALTMLVNAVDTHARNQAELASPAVARLLLRRVRRGGAEVASLACLLLSHLVWDSPDVQRLFTADEEGVVAALLGAMEADEQEQEGEDDDSHPEHPETLSPTRDSPRAVAADDELLRGEDPTEREGIRYVADALEPEAPASAPGAGRAFYALLALINLSHDNAAAQDAAHALNGVRVVLRQLEHPAYDVRKTAAFCLGNLVREHPRNARALADAGGVRALVALLTDDDDDELSKRAFATLANMAELAAACIGAETLALCAPLAAAEGVPGSTAQAVLAASRRLARDACVGVGGSLAPDGSAAAAGAGALDAGDAGDAADGAAAALGKLLPVLNGLLYTSASTRERFAADFNVTPLVLVLSRALPVPVRELALFVLANLCASRAMELQGHSEWVFDCAAALLHSRQLSVDGRAVLYTVAAAQTAGSAERARAVGGRSRLMEHVLGDVRSSAARVYSSSDASDSDGDDFGEEADARARALAAEAAELLLTVVEERARPEGAEPALRHIQATPGVFGEMVSARAGQVLGEAYG